MFQRTDGVYNTPDFNHTVSVSSVMAPLLELVLKLARLWWSPQPCYLNLDTHVECVPNPAFGDDAMWALRPLLSQFGGECFRSRKGFPIIAAYFSDTPWPGGERSQICFSGGKLVFPDPLRALRRAAEDLSGEDLRAGTHREFEEVEAVVGCCARACPVSLREYACEAGKALDAAALSNASGNEQLLAYAELLHKLTEHPFSPDTDVAMASAQALLRLGESGAPEDAGPSALVGFFSGATFPCLVVSPETLPK